VPKCSTGPPADPSSDYPQGGVHRSVARPDRRALLGLDGRLRGRRWAAARQPLGHRDRGSHQPHLILVLCANRGSWFPSQWLGLVGIGLGLAAVALP